MDETTTTQDQQAAANSSGTALLDDEFDFEGNLNYLETLGNVMVGAELQQPDAQPTPEQPQS